MAIEISVDKNEFQQGSETCINLKKVNGKFNCNKCDKPYGKMAHLNHHHQVVHKDFHMLAKNVASYLHRDTTLICILDMYIKA